MFLLTRVYCIRSPGVLLTRVYCIRSPGVLLTRLYCIRSPGVLLTRLYCIGSPGVLLTRLYCIRSPGVLLTRLYCIRSPGVLLTRYYCIRSPCVLLTRLYCIRSPGVLTNESILYKVPWCSTNENILYKVPWCSTNEDILLIRLLLCNYSIIRMSNSSSQSGRLSPNSTQDITVVYQRTGTHPQEIHLLSIQVKNIPDPQVAYSRFKTSVCRLFQLPKSTPFMLKDTVSGAKMTRDRFSEYLRARSFPLVWRLITALPGEEGNRVPLAQGDSCATFSSNHSELQSQSSTSLIETHSLNSLAHTLSLGWNDNTNTYGLETKCIQVPFLERQLVFISKRAQSLSLSAPLQSLSVGDLILKIDSRPVEDMSREEIGLHLNYPQANLAPIPLLVLPWTDSPQELKDLILDSMQTNQDPLPTTCSEPSFWSIPVTAIDYPLSPDPVRSPATSPRKRKSRHPFSTGDTFQSKTSPAKKMGLLSGTKLRARSSSSVSRSDSFSFIPSWPPEEQVSSWPPEEQVSSWPPEEQVSSCTPEEHVPSCTPGEHVSSYTPGEHVPSYTPGEHVPSNTPEVQVHLCTPVEHVPSCPPEEQVHLCIPEEHVPSCPPEEQVHLCTPEEHVPSYSPEEQVHLCTPEEHVPSCPPEEHAVFSPIRDPLIPSCIEYSDFKPELISYKPELTLSLCDDVTSHPDSNCMPNAVSADISETKQEPMGIPADTNPEETLVPFSTKQEPMGIPADTNPELTLVPFRQESELEPTFSAAAPLSPQLEPVPRRLDPPPVSHKYSRSVSDPKANRVYPSRDLSSSSSDMETECVTGTYDVLDANNRSAPEGTYSAAYHHYEVLEDTYQPPQPAPRHKTTSKHSSDPLNSNSPIDQLDTFRNLIASARQDTNALTEILKTSDPPSGASSCTEFVNPSFQGPVHGVYRSFDLNQPSKRVLSKRRITSHLDTMDIGIYTQTKSTNEIAFFGSSSEESDGEDLCPFHTSRHLSAVPIGLITPVRPRKLPQCRDPIDTRPASDLMIPRSTSEVSNLAGAAHFFEDPGRLASHRARMARKQKTMLSPNEDETMDLGAGFRSPSVQVPNGKGHSFEPDKKEDRKTRSTFYSGKPAEFVHPAYRSYQSIGNMEISEKMCSKLREKFQPISCGPLSRKHEFDGKMRRRATDRSWKTMYVHLLESDLIFYKSERDYLYDKPFLKTLSRDRTERHFLYDQIVSLHHAKLFIPNDYMALKRNSTSYVFRFETENTSTYLIRAVSLPLMFGWILSFVEARVLPPTDHPHSTGLYQDPDKRRKTTIEGANRYLQRIQQKMKSRLNFTRRDSETSLEPIFCPDISRCVRAHENDKVPLLVEMCIKEIEDRALESEGIYRVSGTARHIKSLRDDLSRGVEVELEDERWLDENNVAGLFKLFFKELTEPLVGSQVYNSLVSTINKETDSQGQLIREIQQLIQAMPDTNLCTLDYVVAHLCRVAQCVDKNRMSVRNLAIVFGPTLVTRRDLTSIELISETNAQVCIMEQLIINYNHIFNCAPIPDSLFESKRSPSSLSNHAIVRAARSSGSGFQCDRIRRVSSTDPPHPLSSNSPTLPYPDPHPSLESKLSRSWSEEVLSHASLIGESFGSDLFRAVPLHSLLETNTSSTLPTRLQEDRGHTHPLSNTHWNVPSLDKMAPLSRRDSK